MPNSRTLILNNQQIEQKINRIAYEIYENHFKEKSLLIVGIEKKGLVLAEKIKQKLEEISPLQLELTGIKINKESPLTDSIDFRFDSKKLKNKTVVLIDDVLNSGKTLIYATKYILDFPVKSISTVVLVNRRHRLFPIRADFVGLTLSTTIQEHISVEFTKGKSAVYLQ